MATFNFTGTNAGAFFECRDFVNDDYTLVITLSALNLSGYTLAGHLYAANGVEIVGAVAVVLTNPASGVFTATIAGQTLAATPYYGPLRWSVYRTDTGVRTLMASGTLDLIDPSSGTPPI